MTQILAIRLAQSCAYSANAPEWEQFIEAVMPTVALAARRICAVWGECSSPVVNEIVQEVFLKLCEDDRKILRELEDRGNDPFLKLLRKITASVGTDYFRRQNAEKRGGRSATISLEIDVSIDSSLDRHDFNSIEWPTLISQLDGLLRLHARTVSDRDRSLFWLYYRQGLTAEAISRIPAIGLTAKGVESALVRLTRLLRETVVQGKPAREIKPVIEIPNKKLQIQSLRKGFSGVIAIDSVKHR